MTQDESKHQVDQAPVAERSVEVAKPAQERRAEQLQNLDKQIERVSQAAKGSDELGVIKTQAEGEMAGKISVIETDSGTSVSDASKKMIREHVVDEPVAFASEQGVRLHELQERRSEVVLENALDKILAYNSPEMKAKQDGPMDAAYVYPSVPDAKFAVIGVSHTSNPESKMAASIKESRDAFLKTNRLEDAVIMIEGRYGGMNAEKLKQEMQGVGNEDDAVRKFGESGIVLWSANEALKEGKQIEIESPERPQKEIATELVAQGFSQQDIGLYLTMRQFTSAIGLEGKSAMSQEQSSFDFARTFLEVDSLSGTDWIPKEFRAEVDTAIAAKDMDQVKRLVPRILSEYASGANEAFAKLPGMEEKMLIPSVDGMVKRNDGVMDAEKVPIDLVNAFHDPQGNDSEVNRISAAWNRERDKFLVKRMDEAMKRGKKPLVVYGASHAIAIEPALNELGK